MEGRTPPYDNEAEKSILGSVLLNNSCLREVRSITLDADCFYVEANRRIFQAMVALDSEGQPIDHVTLGNKLSENNDLEKIGGPMALDGLTRTIASSANVTAYGHIIMQLQARRKMIYAAQQIVAEGYYQQEPTDEYLTKARSDIILAANSLIKKSTGPRHIDEDLVEIYKELAEKKEPEGLIKTGFGTLDSVTGGLWPGLMVVLAARPGMGKSAFILNIATNVALSGKKVLYITLEDARKYVVYRMLARFANIDLTDLMLRKVNTQEQYARVIEAMNKISGKKPLWLEDASALTSEEIAQIAANHKELHGLDLLVIDHLGESGDKGESQTAITTIASRNYRNIAKDLNIPVVLVSQLNRDVERRPDKHPILSDLRQSGEIEAAARSVWFLYREGCYMGEEGEDRRDTELLIAKTNHGRLGMVKLFAKLEHMYMRGWDVPQDGLWPSDQDKEYVPKSQQSDKKEFFNKGQPSHYSETDKDRY